MHARACVLIAFNRRNVSFMGYAAAVVVYVWVDLCVCRLFYACVKSPNEECT